MSSAALLEHLLETDQVLVKFSVPRKDWEALSAYFQESFAHKEDESPEPFLWYLIDCAMGRNGSDESRLIGELMERYCSSLSNNSPD